MTSIDALRDSSQELTAEAVRCSLPTISWTTQLLVGLDVAVQGKSPWMSITACTMILSAVVLTVLAVMTIAGVSLQGIYAAIAMFIVLHWLLSGRIIDGFAHRRRGRPTRPDEVAALRRHARPDTWPCVRDAAADWRRSCPKIPITIAMILDWEDKAFRKVHAAMPPTDAEQAAVRALALAFE